MVFIKHSSLKSDIFFNPIFIPRFPGSMYFRVQVFQSPDLDFRMGQGFAESGFRFQVQGLGPGFRSSPNIIREGNFFFYENLLNYDKALLIMVPQNKDIKTKFINVLMYSIYLG